MKCFPCDTEKELITFTVNETSETPGFELGPPAAGRGKGEESKNKRRKEKRDKKKKTT